MKTVFWTLAGLGLFLGASGAGLSEATAGPVCGGSWVRVGNGCVLPQDLSIGDRVLLSIGSAVNREGIVLGYADCDGQRGYYTSANQSGCGFRNAIAAYHRNNTGTGTEAQATNALKVPQ